MNNTKIKSVENSIELGDGDRSFTCVMTSKVIDRDGDMLLPGGMDSKDFEKNPILFFNHSWGAMPVGTVTGIKRQGDRIIARCQMAERPESHPDGEEWEADTILSLIKQGVIKGVSVGFEPIDGRKPTDDEIKSHGDDLTWVFTKWKLLELSIAPLPCNQDALVLAVSKGFKKDTVKKYQKQDEKPKENKKTVISVPIERKKHIIYVDMGNKKTKRIKKLAIKIARGDLYE